LVALADELLELQQETGQQGEQIREELEHGTFGWMLDEHLGAEGFVAT
jgi:hypothetical protein